MPLSPPAPRTAQHQRRVTYFGYLRDDGLWDIEGELHDSKCYDLPQTENLTPRPAGAPIHHMWLRVTVDTRLVVQGIEAVMDAHPLAECPQVYDNLQRMVGSCMAQGWRKDIQRHLGGVAGCTHLRELLFNLATAAFQSITGMFKTQDPDVPPRHLGQCKGWDFDGPGVQQYVPQFYRRGPQSTLVPAPLPGSAEAKAL